MEKKKEKLNSLVAAGGLSSSTSSSSNKRSKKNNNSNDINKPNVSINSTNVNNPEFIPPMHDVNILDAEIASENVGGDKLNQSLHVEGDSSSSAKRSSNGSNTKKCSFFASGKCKEGDNCIYSHDFEPKVFFIFKMSFFSFFLSDFFNFNLH